MGRILLAGHQNPQVELEVLELTKSHLEIKGLLR